MMDFFMNVNWQAVLAGGVIYAMVGGLWYGPIAGKAWMEEVGLTEEEIKEAGNQGILIFKSFISAVVLSTGLALVLYNLGIEGSLQGAVTGFVLSVLVIGGGTFPNYIFEDKSMRHFLIHLGNVAVAMTLIGAMMGYWR